MLNLRKEDISSALSDLDLMKFILLRQVWSMKRGNHHSCAWKVTFTMVKQRMAMLKWRYLII